MHWRVALTKKLITQKTETDLEHKILCLRHYKEAQHNSKRVRKVTKENHKPNKMEDHL